jgi:hypothetical protein
MTFKHSSDTFNHMKNRTANTTSVHAKTYDHTKESTWNAKLPPSESTFLCFAVNALPSLIKAGLHDIILSFLFYWIYWVFLKTQAISLWTMRFLQNYKEYCLLGGDTVKCNYWCLNETVSFFRLNGITYHKIAIFKQFLWLVRLLNNVKFTLLESFSIVV